MRKEDIWTGIKVFIGILVGAFLSVEILNSTEFYTFLWGVVVGALMCHI